ncbi:hypothetical protein [Stenotrophomonas sp.]|uniref:hypothetical protein n=1 Tax=Stenotrophomonas sp. TaxID=69392 RepID=UPI0028974ADC|nr:hypothetical protein [Stenotrophomonas sp.]
MTKEQDEPLAPVAGWKTGTVPAYGIGFVTLRYLVSPTETLEQAHSSPNYAMTVPQLRELGQRMLFLADQLEKTPQTSAGSPQH